VVRLKRSQRSTQGGHGFKAMKGGRRVSSERWLEISSAARQARIDAAEKWGAEQLPVIESARAAGALSLRQIAAALNAQGITAPRGGPLSAVQVQRALWAARWYRVRQEDLQSLRERTLI
jgi:hypothetical protein